MIPKASEEDISEKIVASVFTSKIGNCVSSAPKYLLGAYALNKRYLKTCIII